MRVDRTEDTDSRYRHVEYFMPRCRLWLAFYYTRDRPRAHVARRKLHKKKKQWKYQGFCPTMEFENAAAMVMFETYLVALLKTYRAPPHRHKKGSYMHALFVWHDILDRYIGGSYKEHTLYMNWNKVNELAKEMRHAGKFPDAGE